MAQGRGELFIELMAGINLKKSENQITDDLKAILPERIQTLQLHARLDQADINTMERYMKGQVVSAEKLNRFMKNTMAIQQEDLLKQVKDGEQSVYVTNQLADIMEEVAKKTGMANLAIKDMDLDFLSQKVTEVTLALNGMADATQTIRIPISKEGKPLLDTKIFAKSNLEKDLKESVAIIKNAFKEIEKIKVDAINKGLTSDSMAGEVQVRTLAIAKEQEKYNKLLDNASNRSLINIEEQIRKEKELEETIKEKNAIVEKAVNTATTFKSNQDAKKATEQLLNLEVSMLKVMKQISLEEDSNVALLTNQLDLMNTEASVLKDILKTRGLINDEFKQRNDLNLKQEEEKIESKYADKSLGQIEKEQKNVIKAYKEYEVARQTGNKKAETSAMIQMQHSLEAIELEYESSVKKLQTATALEDFDRKYTLSQAEQIKKQQALNDEIKIEVEQRQKSYSASFGKNDFDGKALPKVDMNQAQELENSEVALNEFVKSVFGAEASIVKFNAKTDETGRYLNATRIRLDQTGDTYREATIAVDTFNNELVISDRVVKSNKAAHASFAEKLQQTFTKLSAYVGVSTLIYGALAKIREGFQFIKDLDKELTNVAITTGMSKDKARDLGEAYSELGIAMGKTTMEIAAANTELVRQGLSLEESERRLEQVIKLSAVGAISTSEALKVITSGVNAMKVSAEELSDVLVNAGQLSASSVEELGQAFQKVASSAYASNMQLTEATSILATMTEVTQEDAGSVGTALKTMIARFNNITDATDGTDEALNKVEEAIESVGVAFTDSQGQVRNLFDILTDLNGVWDGLDQNTRSYIATQAAGTRQQNKFFAVMDNFNRVLDLNNQLLQSSGKLQEGYNVYLDSLEAKANSAKAALDKLWQNEVVPQLIEAAAEGTRALASLIDKVGLFGTALAGIGFSFVASDFKKLWAESTTTVIEGGKAATVSGKAFSKLASLGSQAASGTMQAGAAFKALGNNILTVGKIATVTFAKMALQFAAIMVPIMLVVGAIKLIIDATNKHKEAVERANQEVQNFTKEVLNQSTTVSNLSEAVERYNELKEKVGTGNIRERLGTAEYQEFLALNEQINKTIPHASSSVDDYGETIYNLSSEYKDLNELIERNLELKKEEILSSEDYKDRLESQKQEASLITSYIENVEKSKEKLKELTEEKKKHDEAVEQGEDSYFDIDQFEQNAAMYRQVIRDTQKKIDDLVNGNQISGNITEFGVLYDFDSEYEKVILRTEKFREDYIAALDSGEDLESFAERIKGTIDSIRFEGVTKSVDDLINKINKDGASDLNINSLKNMRLELEKMQDSEKVGDFGFEVLSDLITQVSAEIDKVQVKLNNLTETAMNEMSRFEGNVEDLESAFEKVKEGDLLSVEEITKLRDASEEAYQYYLKTGDASFQNGQILKNIANDQKDALKKQLIILRDKAEAEVFITRQKMNQLSLTRSALMSERELARMDGDVVTEAAINAALVPLQEASQDLAFLEGVISSLDDFSTTDWDKDDKDKKDIAQLEKYFEILKKITRLEQEAALLEFKDQSDASKLTKQRIENINAQIAAQTELYNARVKHLSTLYVKEKQINELSENYVDLKNEIKEEEEAIRDITLNRLELEESILEVIRSNFNLYATELQGIEVIQAKISLLDAQGLEDSEEKINLTKLLAKAESDLAVKKSAELNNLLKISKDITLTESNREKIMAEISRLQVEILGHETNSANLLKELETIDEDRLAKLEERKTGIRDFYSMVEELVRGELEQKVDALEKELQMAQDILDTKMDELDQAKKMDDLEEKRAKRSQELSKIVAKIASLQAAADSGDIKAKNEILKLQEEEKEKRLDIAEEQEDESYEAQKQALQDVYDIAEKGIEATKKEIEDTLNDVSKMQMLVNQRITDSMKDMTGLQQELIRWNRIHGTGIDEDITSKWKTAYDQAEEYFKLLEKNKAPFNVNNALNSGLGTQDQTGTNTNSTNSQSFLDSMKSLMLKNSELYKNALSSKTMSDAEKTGIMNSAKMMNQVIGKLAGFIFDSASGVWYTDASKKQRLYDNGGLKPKGETGFMAENVKEWVFDDAQLKAVQRMAISEFMKTNNNLEAGSSNNMINIIIEGDVTDDNLNKITNDLKNIVREVSKGQVEIFRQRGLKPSLRSR